MCFPIIEIGLHRYFPGIHSVKKCKTLQNIQTIKKMLQPWVIFLNLEFRGIYVVYKNWYDSRIVYYKSLSDSDWREND